MAWVKTETVSQSPTATGVKAIAESWAVNDRDGNAVMTLAKDGMGVTSLTFSGTINPADNGTTSGAVANVTVAETAGVVRKTVFTLANAVVPMADDPGVGGYGGSQLYSFPQGAIHILGATTNLALTISSTQVETATVTAAAGCTGDGDLIVTITGAGLTGSPLNVTVALTTALNTAALVAGAIRTALAANTAIAGRYTVGGSSATVTLSRAQTAGPDATLNIDINADDAGTTATGITNAATSTNTTTGIAAAWDGDFSLGSAVVTNNGGGLAGDEADILPSTATPQAVAGVTTATGRNTAAAYIDGTTSPVDVFLNFLIDDADQDIDTETASIIATGTVTIVWVNLGDY